MELGGAKSHLRTFQECCRVQKRNVTRTVADRFEPVTKLLNEDVLADASLSTELVSLMTVLATAQSEKKKAQDQLAFLQQ